MSELSRARTTEDEALDRNAVSSMRLLSAEEHALLYEYVYYNFGAWAAEHAHIHQLCFDRMAELRSAMAAFIDTLRADNSLITSNE